MGYKAKAANREIFLAETQRDIAQTMYSNLKDFKVEMPHNVIVGAGSGNGNGGDGAGKMPSNLDVITAFSALGLMEKARMQEMEWWRVRTGVYSGEGWREERLLYLSLC